MQGKGVSSSVGLDGPAERAASGGKHEGPVDTLPAAPAVSCSQASVPWENL